MSSLTISMTDTDLRAPDSCSATVSQRIFGCAGLALFEKIVPPLGQIGEIGNRVAQHVFRHRAGEELHDERSRDIAAAFSQRGAGLLDGGAGGVFVLAGGKFGGHGAGRWLWELVEHGSEVFLFQGGRREQPTIW